MTKFLKILSLGIFVIFLNANYATAQKPWTKIVYIIGSDLESKSDAGTTDIEEMLDAGNTDQVNVVIITGGANKEGWETPKAYLIENGQKLNLDFTPVSNEMSSPENVTAFINYALDAYPGDKVSMVFWNHGSDIRGYGNDELSKKNLSLPQIKAAIGATNFIQSNKKFELLGFDACLMSNIETQSTLREFAHWFVGSEEQEPGHGWDYKPIISAMNSQGSALSGDNLGRIIVDGFFAQAADQHTTALTLSVTDLTRISDLENSLNNLFSAAIAGNAVQKIYKARSKTEEYSKALTDPEYSEDMVDLGDLMKKVKETAPELGFLANDVLSQLGEVVVYSRNDNARPKATGISIYMPHQVLVNKDVLDEVLNDNYSPIDFNPDIKSFILDYYIPTAIADLNPPNGQLDPDFVFFKKNGTHNTKRGGELISAIRVNNDDDLEQIQVMLIRESESTQNEYLMLGSTFPDTVSFNEDGSATYGYHWDNEWLSINGHPAYISDIFPYEITDDSGNVKQYTRIQIPAVKNLETSSEEFLIVSFSFDENFNYVLESIIPEPESDELGGMIVPKSRVALKPGDKVQLLYESFNEDTDEEFFVVNDDDIIEIVNGNSDLKLEYAYLEDGRYQLAFLLEDHSQNDTLIYDNSVYVVTTTTGAKDVKINPDFEVYPNPAQNAFSLDYNGFDGKPFILNMYDMNGRSVLTKTLKEKVSNIQVDHASGVYLLEINSNGKKTYDKIIINK